MIKARFTKKDNILELEIRGHAGYDNKGMDIVCAAVSILSYSYQEMCLRYDNVEILYRYEKPGYTNICVEDRERQLLSATKMLESGLTALSIDYKDYIELQWDEI